MFDAEGRTIRDELIRVLRRGVDEPLSDADFDRLARRVFAYQFERNAPFAAFCRRRGRTPDAVDHWREIPAVPTAAFKEVALVAGDPADAEAVFRTSGTTRGPARRGVHHVLDLSLYHAALLPSFSAYVMPVGEEMPMLSLVPPAEQMAESSLAHMVAVVVDRLGGEGSGHFAAVGSGLDVEALDGALRRFADDGTPVCLLGTALAFVHWLDRLADRGIRHRLPPGSRLMDTGGFKGRSREVPADELRRAYREWLDIPGDHVVNEYGMTELCSQFYDTVLRDRARPPRGAGEGSERSTGSLRRVKRPPPWVRTEVVDPETLAPVEPAETGLLLHHDLANLGSVSGIQTADLGRRVEDGFVVVGRAAGAVPRGCSVAMDLLLEAVEAERERS